MIDLNTGMDVDWDPGSEEHKRKSQEAYEADRVAHARKKAESRKIGVVADYIDPNLPPEKAIEEWVNRKYPNLKFTPPPTKRKAVRGKNGIPTVEIFKKDGGVVFERFDPEKHGSEWEL